MPLRPRYLMHGTLGSIFRYDALRDEIVGMLIYCLPHVEICNVFNVAMACMSLVTVLAMWACGGERCGLPTRERAVLQTEELTAERRGRFTPLSARLSRVGSDPFCNVTRHVKMDGAVQASGG